MAKTHKLLLAAGLALVAFTAVCMEFDASSTLAFAACGVAPLAAFAAVAHLGVRRFGAAAAALPAIACASAIVLAGIRLYAIALRPFELGHDEFEPNLVFLFAPIQLGLVAVLASAVFLLWARLRRASTPVHR